MFAEVSTVLVQFRLSGTPTLPDVIREDQPLTQTDRVARDKQREGTILFERNGVVPEDFADVLIENGFHFVDARSRERTNGSGKANTLVTFTFSQEPPVNLDRGLELASAGNEALGELLGRRWGRARMIQFPNKRTLRVAIFEHQAEHPQMVRVIPDPEMERLGIAVTQSAKKR